MNLKDNDSKTSNLELFVPYSKMPFCQVNLNWKPENSRVKIMLHFVANFDWLKKCQILIRMPKKANVRQKFSFSFE